MVGGILFTLFVMQISTGGYSKAQMFVKLFVKFFELYPSRQKGLDEGLVFDWRNGGVNIDLFLSKILRNVEYIMVHDLFLC